MILIQASIVFVLLVLFTEGHGIFTHNDTNLSELQISPFFNSSDFLNGEFEDALKSLENANLDVNSFTSASEIAFGLRSLQIVVSSFHDSRLETNIIPTIAESLRLFRSSIQNTVKELSEVLPAIHQSLLAVHTNVNDIPNLLTTITLAYTKQEDKGSKYVIALQMKNYFDIVKISTDELNKVKQVFDNVKKLFLAAQEDINKLHKAFDERKSVLAGDIQRLQNDKMDMIEKNRIKEENSFKLDHDILWEGISEVLEELRRVAAKKEAQEAFKKILDEMDGKIANAENEKQMFFELVNPLSVYTRIVASTIDKLQENCKRLHTFFTSMLTVFVLPVTRNMLTFDSLVQANHIKGSETLRHQVGIFAFKSITVSIEMARIARAYCEVSNKFVFPLINMMVHSQSLSIEEAETEMTKTSQQQQSTAEECQRFTEAKIFETKEISISDITKYREVLQSLLG